MILTVTMNPTVDIQYKLKTLKINTTNRVSKVYKSAGGKGLNVARVLTLAGRKAVATGVIGGKTGELIAQQTEKDGIEDKFLKLSKESRNCVAILHDNGKQTEILEVGPHITKEEGEKFLEKFEQLNQDVKVVTFSGSLPPGLPIDYYKQLIVIAQNNNTKVLLDASGEPLKAVLNSEVRPELVKINLTELNEVSVEPVSNDFESIKNALESKMFAGIKAVIITAGADGAKLRWNDEYYDLTIPQVEVVNPVGSGDSTLAGFAVGLEEDKSMEETLKMGMAFGILNAMEAQTGFINMDNYQMIFEQVHVQKQ